MMRDVSVSLVIAGGGLLTAFLYALDLDSPARAVVSLAFLLLGPGLAIVRLLRFRQPLTLFTLAVAASLGLETVVATTLLATGTWTPGRALAIVVSITVAAVTLEITRKGGDPLPRFPVLPAPARSNSTFRRGLSDERRSE